ncbi:riboflavin synthase subunit alpha [Burkholderiales bacterium GJ-E10]|nr:riboflavin synthase subunit alpha [Burkholderiales bacterium GJ-E10]
MFTGLVQSIGRIVSVQPRSDARDAGVRIEVDAGGLAPRPIALGDSIAVSGVCLTVVDLRGGIFAADVSRETLSKTIGLDAPGAVNLETALALGDKLGGHLMAGHVDGVGEVVRMAPAGESTELAVRIPADLAIYMAPKGSVAVNGVSLTINRVTDRVTDRDGGCEISINLIPHTIAATTFALLVPGARVNIEADLLARYVVRARDCDPIR